jgi:phage/plasmid primase-like uncharacterized protein
MTGAQSITQSQGGKWHGRYGVAACPVCQPERRSDQTALTVSDTPEGRLLAHCKKSGCSFGDLAAALGLSAGDFTKPDPAEAARRHAEQRAEAEKKARQAMAVWTESQPIGGTVAEAYLRGRGLTCALPETLRFHPACWHISAQRLPALVALVEGCDLPAVHRTWLRADGSAKTAVEPPKAMLGSVSGGAVRLAAGPGPLAVAEGIETALSLACGPLSGPAAIWAALSTSGLRGLRLPAIPGALIVAADGDEPGQAAAYALAERANALGWTVTMFPAPEGRDWNDVIQSKKGAVA